MASSPERMHDELSAAIAAERAAWDAIRQRLPGSPGYDPLLWQRWRDAARRCSVAREALACSGQAPVTQSPGHTA